MCASGFSTPWLSNCVTAYYEYREPDILGSCACVSVLIRADLRAPWVSAGCATGAGSTGAAVSTSTGGRSGGCGHVEIINLNNLWGRILCHIHSWELDKIHSWDFDNIHSWDFVIVVFIKVHSWNCIIVAVADQTSMSIGKNQLLGLIVNDGTLVHIMCVVCGLV
jgi:hypothetical protein